MVLAARFSDRVGAGSCSAPRDALLAESVEPQHRGKAFGLEGIGDNLGAFLGPLITVLLFFSLQFDIHTIFYLAIIPGLLAFLMVILVREKKGGCSRKIEGELSSEPISKNVLEVFAGNLSFWSRQFQQCVSHSRDQGKRSLII